MGKKKHFIGIIHIWRKTKTDERLSTKLFTQTHEKNKKTNKQQTQSFQLHTDLFTSFS